jgi:hypothetical protein
MRFLALVGCIVSVLICGAAAARAATVDGRFAPFYLSDEAPGALILSGPIDERSALSFRRALNERPDISLLVLNSPGGLVQMALLIAEEVHERRLDTAIAEGYECSSSCAFIFLAGANRVAEGRLGVHQIYSDRPDDVSLQLHISDILEMLTRFGTPSPLITRMLRTPSDDMYYFSSSELSAMGISRSGRNSTNSPQEPDFSERGIPVPAQSPERSPQTSQELTARSGQVRHPHGGAPLLMAADRNAGLMVKLPNHQKVNIVASQEDWYRARVGGRTGYLHSTWVYVDQFVQGTFDYRYVQIKSFRSHSAAIAYATSGPRGLSVFEAVNGWYAVTLGGQFASARAGEIMRSLRDAKSIPDDSFVTYGNNYVRKVCCN